MAGKGDDYRPVDYKKWCENYDKIFGKKEEKDVKKNKKEDPGLKSKSK